MTRALTAGLLLGLLAVPAAAQEKPQDTPKPQAATAPAETPGQPVNISIEISITENVGSAEPVRKIVKVLVADGMVGRIRNRGGFGATFGELNVDARPRIVEKERILTALTVEYSPRRPEPDNPVSGLHESLSVLLQNGQPLTVAQSADPNADRTVTLEVKATILR